jgi:peptide/nickel transport system permease protein
MDSREVRRRALITLARRHLLGALGLTVLCVVTLIALLAPVLPIVPPNEVATGNSLRPPLSPDHPLGTDDIGRDVLARMVWGARPSLAAGFLAVLGALLPGAAIGLATGYFGGLVDMTGMRAIDVLLAFPPLLLAIALAAGLGPGVTNAVVAISIVSLPTYARVVRGQVLATKELDYVLAARVVGVDTMRLLRRHVAPSIVAPITVVASLDVGQKIIAMASLSFLGLGIQPPDADWGAMLARGRGFMETAPSMVAVPGLAIFALVLSFNFIGDALRDALDPRLR